MASSKPTGRNVTSLTIPADLEFEDLQFTMTSSDDFEFDLSVVDRIAEASGIAPGLLRSRPAESLVPVFVGWYLEHRRTGGEPNEHLEFILAQHAIEQRRGLPSLPSGRA